MDTRGSRAKLTHRSLSSTGHSMVERNQLGESPKNLIELRCIERNPFLIFRGVSR
jgi:hypothetical protein